MGYLAERKREKRRSVVTRILLTLLAFLLIVDLGAPSMWWQDFLAQFRIQYVLAGLALGLVCPFINRWKSALAAFALVIGHLASIAAHVQIYGPPAPEKGSDLKILVHNVLISNTDHKTVISNLKRERPDVAVLTEVSKDLRDKITSQLKTFFPYNTHYLYKESLPAGTLLLSRTPLFETGTISVPELPGGPWGVIRKNGRSLTIAGVHMKHFYSGEGRKHVVRQINRLANFARDCDMPVILAGDFNAAPWTSFLKPLEDHGALNARGGLLPSWPSFLPWPLRVPLDHVYSHRGLEARDTRFLRAAGSDHLPVVITLRVP